MGLEEAWKWWYKNECEVQWGAMETYYGVAQGVNLQKSKKGNCQ